MVLSQLTGDVARTTTDRVGVPATTFLIPPLASVGLTVTEALAEGRDILVAGQQVATIKAMPRPPCAPVRQFRWGRPPLCAEDLCTGD